MSQKNGDFEYYLAYHDYGKKYGLIIVIILFLLFVGYFGTFSFESDTTFLEILFSVMKGGG
ncbi:MAG: hypothetical protein IJ772_02370 [Bacilli bacterium]|nr:hypothetical protein [Bacilli bacterium]MBR1817672.1 hypothetical protein [Bacilli bacterium]